MFRKVLIANRGEIAVRIVRACRDLGISTVAVYSEADRAALHVRLADEARPLGGPASTDSYLAVDKIVAAARDSGAEAVHPGYGFLSENPRLAEACREAGLCFVGPPAESIRLMGDKTRARAAVARAGVPVIPGSARPLESSEEAAEVALRIGYPVILKAAAGGGGKGMRRVEHPARMALDFEAASSEALRSFGDGGVYLERWIERPRHVEIQVLADNSGEVVHLGERECSIQRRHQKVVEESPSPALDDDLRGRMGATAVAVARAAGYTNAGTVEFLLDESRSFYFLEMNTRLQVEHPVTELVTGIDLVRAQLRIAAGEPLGFDQADVGLRGSAIECRVYAEDPDNNFFPSPGRITRLEEPRGPGVRVDSGVYDGWEVPIYYDPLIAKLVVWGTDRGEALARLRRALAEYRIEGIRTNLRFFAELADDPEFVAGRLSTAFIDEYFQRRAARGDSGEAFVRAAALAAALAYGDRAGRPVEAAATEASAWRDAVRPAPWAHRRTWRS